jgi:hypothetical protein
MVESKGGLKKQGRKQYAPGAGLQSQKDRRKASAQEKARSVVGLEVEGRVEWACLFRLRWSGLGVL